MNSMKRRKDMTPEDEPAGQLVSSSLLGKTRDLFKKIRDAKVTFHAKMGSKKNRNGMDVTEAEDINRWQEFT